MPFKEGTTWQVGGSLPSFYGKGAHTGNDFYATDWNCCSLADTGEPVYPIAPGRVDRISRWNGTTEQAYGNFVDVVHPGSPPYKTRYAHLDEFAIDEGDIGEVVFTTTQLGTVGNTGNSYGAHLHLSFKRWHEGNQRWQSLRNDPASRKPSPMWTAEGLETLCNGSTMTVTKEASVFHDVDPTNPKSPYITSLYAHGYAIGCNNDPFEFCPWQKLTRAEMAVLIVRAHNGPDFQPDEPQQVLFVDVDLSAWYAPWVHQLYQDGYTAGCSTLPLRFVPTIS